MTWYDRTRKNKKQIIKKQFIIWKTFLLFNGQQQNYLPYEAGSKMEMCANLEYISILKPSLPVSRVIKLLIRPQKSNEWKKIEKIPLTSKGDCMIYNTNIVMDINVISMQKSSYFNNSHYS